MATMMTTPRTPPTAPPIAAPTLLSVGTKRQRTIKYELRGEMGTGSNLEQGEKLMENLLKEQQWVHL